MAKEIKSKTIRVLDTKMHYMDGGEGDPILFLPDISVSSYTWRHVMPQMAESGRCIAPDLIGTGQSASPSDCQYRLSDHILYIEAFIDRLELKNITLVLHGWGSVIGFDIAARNEGKIKALAFYESFPKPTLNWDGLSLPTQQMLSVLMNSKVSKKAIIDENYFMDKLFPNMWLKKLKPTDMATYQKPFLKPESRQVLWQYILDMPKGERQSTQATQIMKRYSTWLKKSKLPKLLMYSMPGFVTPIATAMWCKKHLTNLELVDVGEGMHFAHETNSEVFSSVLNEWYMHMNKQLALPKSTSHMVVKKAKVLEPVYAE